MSQPPIKHCRTFANDTLAEVHNQLLSHKGCTVVVTWGPTIPS
jgi:hypothetical protein